MDRLLRDMPYFMEVARRKSFTQAADALDVPVSTLSRRIAAMEKSMGVQLLHRSTRIVELTESGKNFYESCDFIVAEVNNARERLVRDLKRPVGRVRLSVQADVYYLFLRGVACSFAAQYPGIEMHVFFSTRWVDLHTEPFDLEIRGGDLPDSDLKVRKLVTANAGLYAAPGLLEIYSAPTNPAELSQLPWIYHDEPGSSGLELRKDDTVEAVSLRPAHVVNNIAASLEFTLEGLGAAALELSVAGEYEKKGQLVRLLPDWHIPGFAISVVMAGDQLPYRVRLFVDHLATHFASLPTCTM